MSLKISREELPLDISPSLLRTFRIGAIYMWRRKGMNEKKYSYNTNGNNTYSSVKEVKLENDDGIGPLKPVPKILL